MVGLFLLISVMSFVELALFGSIVISVGTESNSDTFMAITFA